MPPKTSETQAFLPTKSFDCSFQDLCAIISIMTIIILFTIAGIIVGSLSAANLTTCANALPYGDSQSFSLSYNSSQYTSILIQGDIKTTIYFDPTLHSKIEVYVNRTSLLDNTYTLVNNTVIARIENGTGVIRINTTVPVTDFTNCFYVTRIIRLPANLYGMNIKASVYVNDLVIQPDPSASPNTKFVFNVLTIMSGTNLVNLTQLQGYELYMGGRKGQVYISNSFAVLFIVSTSGDITYNSLSSIGYLYLYTTYGTLQGTSLSSVNGSVILVSTKSKQIHNGISGAKTIELGTEDGTIDATLNSNDFQGELQIQDSSLSTSVLNGKYHTITQYSSVSSRLQTPATFGGDASATFTPTYAGYIGAYSYASTNLMKIRVLNGGARLNNLVV